MRFVIIHAGGERVQGLGAAVDIISRTLSELDGAEVSAAALESLSLPHFTGRDGAGPEAALRGLGIPSAGGVALVSAASAVAPCSLMVSFLERMMDARYAGMLKGKNCLVVTLSQSGGERAAADCVSAALSRIGAYESGRAAIGAAYAGDLARNPEYRAIIERHAEDFYRAARQSRKAFIPSAAVPEEAPSAGTLPKPAPEPVTAVPYGLSARAENEAAHLNNPPKDRQMNAGDIYKKYSLNTLTPEREAEIDELTRIFTEKHAAAGAAPRQPEPRQAAPAPAAVSPALLEYAAPRLKSCKQATFSLPHFYKPQPGGVDMVIQISIEGERTGDDFSAYLSIKNRECECYDGARPNPDITIISGERAWMDIMRGKLTAQKSFMTGRVKVRGNFAFLPKFDQAFSFSTTIC